MRTLNPFCYGPFVILCYVYHLQHDRSFSSSFKQKIIECMIDKGRMLHSIFVCVDKG